MARIRTIKPEFWTDEKIVSLSPLARLLFIGMWNFVDDDGRGEFSPKRLEMQILPADSVDISELLGELRGENLIKVYSVDNKEYFEVCNFTKHQKVDKRSKSKHPSPPNSPELPQLPPTEKEREKEKEGDQGKDSGGADAQKSKNYAFKGKIIRLSQEDFDRWKEVYSAIPDLVSELSAADDYYSENPPSDGKWFFPVSNWMKRAHQKAASEGKVDVVQQFKDQMKGVDY